MAACVFLCQAACVQRRLLIRSDPPGAVVYVDDYEIGTTPVATNFTYYGTRKLRLVKDGYETLTVMQPIPPPWYEVPPLDFVSENLIPGEIRDHRVLNLRLTPQLVVPTEQLLQRAEDLRRGTYAVPPPGPSVAVPPVSAAPGAAQPYFPPPEAIPTPPPSPPVAPGSAGPAPPGGQPFQTLPPGGWTPQVGP